MLIYKESKIQLNVAYQKKLKKVIDFKILFWYINEATCGKPYISTKIKKLNLLLTIKKQFDILMEQRKKLCKILYKQV